MTKQRAESDLRYCVGCEDAIPSRGDYGIRCSSRKTTTQRDSCPAVMEMRALEGEYAGESAPNDRYRTFFDAYGLNLPSRIYSKLDVLDSPTSTTRERLDASKAVLGCLVGMASELEEAQEKHGKNDLSAAILELLSDVSVEFLLTSCGARLRK